MVGYCCQAEWNEKLLLYLDKELAAAEHAALQTHLQECPHCARELERLHSMVGQLSADPGLLRTADGFGACIPADSLVALASDACTSPEQAFGFERHMLHCRGCREEYALLRQLQVQVPGVHDSRPLISFENFLALVSRHYGTRSGRKSGAQKHILQRLRISAQAAVGRIANFFRTEPRLVAVRKTARRFEEHIHVVTDTKAPFPVRIEIEYRDSGTVDILVRINPGSAARDLKDVQVCFVCQGQERASLYAERGIVEFHDIEQAHCRIILISGGRELKSVVFDTRRSSS